MRILDGAVGPFTDPVRLAERHHAYLEAGADIVTSATFVAGPTSARAVQAARAAADDWSRRTPRKPRQVAGAIGPIKPADGAEVLAYRNHVRALLDAGVDLLLVETVVHLGSARTALAAIADEFAARGQATPLMISASLTRDGRLLSGEDLEGFYALARTASPFSVGLNCSLGVRHLVPFVERLAAIADCRISCHPSAGIPGLSRRRRIAAEAERYPESPAEMAAALTPLIASDRLDIVGGCCGTTPEYIRTIAAAVADSSTR